MVDVSNHNGYMTYNNFIAMRNQYGVKAMTCKLSEGTYYADPTARTAISNAEKAGLYVNGYHFARWHNPQSAAQEAHFAVACAKNAGLPTNAVLVDDVESPQQMNSTYYLNQQSIITSNSIVQQAGYRPDTYSMSSWLNYHFPTSLVGWVANYPYNLNQNLFSNKHGWQFRSDQYFNSSYGKFDASQLYDNYYTGGQDKNAVISNQDTHNVSTNSGCNNKGNNPHHAGGQSSSNKPNVLI